LRTQQIAGLFLKVPGAELRKMTAKFKNQRTGFFRAYSQRRGKNIKIALLRHYCGALQAEFKT